MSVGQKNPLTDDEVIQLATETVTVTFSWDENDIKFARAIEQKVWGKMKCQLDT